MHCQLKRDEHTADQTDSRGRCLGVCAECGEHLESTGRYTTFCPSCDTCPTCRCPNADGFAHYAGCADAPDDDDSGEDHDDDSGGAEFADLDGPTLAAVSEIETPNLDDLDADALDAVRRTLAILARYAHTKRRAILARQSGSVPDALRLESQTDALYNRLPDAARSW